MDKQDSEKQASSDSGKEGLAKINAAVDSLIKKCKEKNILKDFFEKHENAREAVFNTCLNIWVNDYLYKVSQDARKEALREAEEKNHRENLAFVQKMKEGGLSITQIKAFTGLSSDVIEKL